MSKEIAVYLNSFGQTAELNESGHIEVFLKKQGQWNVIKEVPFKIESAKGMKEIRSEIIKIAEVLDTCKIFVAKKITGLAYTVLEKMEFNNWEMDGEPHEFLEYVLNNEEEDEASTLLTSCESVNVIEPVESDEKGYYTLDLKELQERNLGITSKQALQPFLNNVVFYELEVTCTHIPGWLERELDRLHLNSQILKSSPNDFKVTISKKTCME